MNAEERKTTINRLYEMENKECSKYTDDENLFIFKCIHSDDEFIRKVAKNTATVGITPYLTKKAWKYVSSKNKVGNLYDEHLAFEEVLQAGFMAFSKKIELYEPITYNTKISSYVTSWIDEYMKKALAKEIKGLEYPEYVERTMALIEASKPILKSRGIESPTAQDYYNYAVECGKDTSKYNLTNFEKTLDLMNQQYSLSIEELEDSGVQIPSNNNEINEIIENDDANEIFDVIDKMGYFDKTAITCRMSAYETCTSEERYNENDVPGMAYELFIKETGLEDLSKKDFIRLLAEAKNELQNRMKRKTIVRERRAIINNSLSDDESLDLYFAEEFSVDNSVKDNIINKEFNERYPLYKKAL